MGGRQDSSGSYDYSLLGSELALLNEWLPKVQPAMAGMPELVDVDTDIDDKGRRVELVIEREEATSLGVDLSLIASTLNNTFSQYGRETCRDRVRRYV